MNEQKWYEKHGEFLDLLKIARKNNDKDFENYILVHKVVELMKKEDKVA